MVEGPHTKVVFYVAAIFFSLFVGQWILDFFAFRSEWCVDSEVDCFREWVGALSGWAAAFAALATFGILRTQIRDQKRQTDYVVGDTDPGVDAVQHITDREEVVVRITNLNRRNMLIYEIGCATVREIAVMEITRTMGGQTTEISSGINPKFEQPIQLGGWRDRSSAPPMLKIVLVAADENANLVVHWNPGNEVFVKAQLIGQRTEARILVGEITPMPA